MLFQLHPVASVESESKMNISCDDLKVCLCIASSSSQCFDYLTNHTCGCCNFTLATRDADTGSTFTRFLRRVVCGVKHMGPGCRLSTAHTVENVYVQRKKSASLAVDYNVTQTGNVVDEESSDSGCNISQESTIFSGNSLMVANPGRMLDERPSQLDVARVPLIVRQTFPSTDTSTGKAVSEKKCETYRKNPQAIITKAEVLWEIDRPTQSPEKKHRSCSPKLSAGHPHDDHDVDCTGDKLSATKREAAVSSEDNGKPGYNDEYATKSFNSKEELKTSCDLEDLFTKRKTQDSEVLTSRQIDSVIQVRLGSAPDVAEDDDTVAKQPVASVATVTNRLVLLDNDAFLRVIVGKFYTKKFLQGIFVYHAMLMAEKIKH